MDWRLVDSNSPKKVKMMMMAKRVLMKRKRTQMRIAIERTMSRKDLLNHHYPPFRQRDDLLCPFSLLKYPLC
jgi:hypothetical protein